MRRVLCLVLLCVGCGSATETTSPAAGPATSTSAPGDGRLATLPVDPNRRIESLSDDERRTLGAWLRANVPSSDTVCPDGHTAHGGFPRAELDESVGGPPPDPDAPMECLALTVLDHVGCQLAAGDLDPCSPVAAFDLDFEGAPCGAFARCMAAATGGMSH